MACRSISQLVSAFVGFLMTFALAVQTASANYPHMPEFGVDCTPCHFGQGGMYPVDGDCLSCHDGTAALEVVGHSSGTTTDKYGTWSMPCLSCHDGMYQQQFRA